LQQFCAIFVAQNKVTFASMFGKAQENWSLRHLQNHVRCPSNNATMTSRLLLLRNGYGRQG